MKHVLFSLINNGHPDYLKNELPVLFSKSLKIEIASAFVGTNEIKAIEEYLISNKKLEVYFVTGLYQRFNSVNDLRLLQSLEKRYEGRFFIQISENERFHWKLYNFYLKDKSVVSFIGSANFTTEGLGTEGELTLRVKGNRNANPTRQFIQHFSELFEQETISLTGELIKRYSKVYKSNFKPKEKSDLMLAKLLRKPLKIKSDHTKKTEIKYRLIWFDRNLSKKDQLLIESNTDWIDKDFDYAGINTKRVYDATEGVKKIIYLYYNKRNKKDTTFTLASLTRRRELPEADTKYYIAYTQLNNTKTISFAENEKALTEIGFHWKSLKRDRMINQDTWNKFIQLCKKRKV